MEFAISLIQKIPAGWPRWVTLAAILLASFIWLGTLRTSFLYGLTMPLALVLLVFTVAHK